jgi:hypothetical protein
MRVSIAVLSLGVIAALAWRADAGGPTTLEDRVTGLEARFAAFEGRLAALEARAAPGAVMPAPVATTALPTPAQRAALIAVARFVSESLLQKRAGADLLHALSPEHQVAWEQVAADVAAGRYGFTWTKQKPGGKAGLIPATLNIALKADIDRMSGVLDRAMIAVGSDYCRALEAADLRRAHELWLQFEQQFM